MEFVKEQEALEVLRECGLEQVPQGDDLIHLQMRANDDVVFVHLADEKSTIEPQPGARVVPLAKDQIPAVLEHIIHRLHLDQILLIPVGKWRRVFDCVAFSLAENESWQEFDASATVELNRRDPLLCTPADYSTVRALLDALVNDAEEQSQGLMVTATAAPMLLEFVPGGAMRISLGNQAIADEVLESVDAGS